MAIARVIENYVMYLNYSELPSFGMVEFYVSEKMVPEEFSLFHKIFTPAISVRKSNFLSFRHEPPLSEIITRLPLL
jgi:hypothetical protein